MLTRACSCSEGEGRLLGEPGYCEVTHGADAGHDPDAPTFALQKFTRSDREKNAQIWGTWKLPKYHTTSRSQLL